MPTVLVVGAGPTGIGAAVRLTESGVDHVVVEASAGIGGMSASVTDEHGFTWDLGGHVLHSHFADFDAAVAASGVELRDVTRNGWVWLDGRGPEHLVPTPIQQQLTELPTDLRPTAPVHNLADYYRNHFGQQLYEQFFEPYNRKMWMSPLERIDDSWTSLRSGSTARNVPSVGLAGATPTAVEAFPYPVGGTGALWQGIHDRLMTPDSVRLRTAVVDLDVPGRTATLADGSTLRYEHCVSTLPITTTLGWLGRPGAAGRLRSGPVHAVGLGYTGAPPPALADKTWLYCPDPAVGWYRATVLSNYDPGNAGAGRWNVLCEVSGQLDGPVPVSTAVTGAVASMGALGVDDATRVSTFHRLLPMGYPVPTLGRDDVLREADAALTAHGVFSRGRFGGWRYESSNQDYAYVQGRQAVDAALSGAAEDAYWHPERF